MAIYNYIKSPVSVGTLRLEIITESTIVTDLDYIRFRGPETLDIVFSGTLSPVEQTSLDVVVSGHSGQYPVVPAELPSGDFGEGYLIFTDGVGTTIWSDGFTSTISGVDPVQDYHLATKGYVDATITGALVTGNLPSVQIVRTTDYTFTSSWADVTFDTTDIENKPSVIEHDNINTDRILIKENGLYQVSYGFSIGSAATGIIQTRVRKNDSIVLPNSFLDEGSVIDSSEGNDTGTRVFLVNLINGDFLSLQAIKVSGSHTFVDDTSFSVVKLAGVKGDQGSQGIPGTGSTINVMKDSVLVASGVGNLNFEGDVSVVDEGGGKATVTISGGGATSSCPDQIFAETYANCFTLTIDSNLVDSDLLNFPVRLHIGGSSGKSGVNTTAIFDKLGVNKKKLAVSDESANELYVEVEEWDSAAGTADLWVKVLTVSSGVSTKIYLWYDSAAPDNTNYVGEPGDNVSQNVWDTDYMGVWHLHETAGIHSDSTSNNIDGTNNGSTQDATGYINGANSFTTNDYISMGNNPYTDSDYHTLEAWVYNNSGGSTKHNIMNQGSINPPYEGRSIDIKTSTGAIGKYLSGDKWSTKIVQQNTWTYVVLEGYKHASSGWLKASISGSTFETFFSGDTSDLLLQADGELCIGRWGGGGSYFEGIIDEVRISNTNRSASWIKASYNSGNDSLITWGGDNIKSVLAFGSEFQEIESDSESSTTSSVYQQKIRLTTGTLPLGKHRIGWSAEVKNTDITGEVYSRIQIDDIDTISEIIIEPSDIANYYSYSGFKYKTTFGIIAIDMDFKQVGAGTAYIRKARIEIWRVS